MSYTPTAWKDGDLVTSAKLNKLENGINNLQSIVIQATSENDGISQADQTTYITLPQNMPSYNDLSTAFNNGVIPHLIVTGPTEDKTLYTLSTTEIYDDTCYVRFISCSQYDNSNLYIDLLSNDVDAPLQAPQYESL